MLRGAPLNFKRVCQFPSLVWTTVTSGWRSSAVSSVTITEWLTANAPTLLEPDQPRGWAIQKQKRMSFYRKPMRGDTRDHLPRAEGARY